MRIGTEDKKKLAVLGVVGALGIGAAVYIYTSLVVPDAPAPASPVALATGPVKATTMVRSSKVGDVAGGTAKSVGTTSAQLDPTLKMGPMLVTEALVYSGSGRNIFSFNSAPIDIPKPVASVRPKGPVPVFTPLPGPPALPPIDLKFFGTATSANGHRQAFLLKGEDVFLASDGDIVQRRYKVLTISANSVLVEDMANNNRQSLPLIGH